ncbi:MAG: hypothetical protein ACREQI_07055 [Candidatus Binataceae bacterium]
MSVAFAAGFLGSSLPAIAAENSSASPSQSAAQTLPTGYIDNSTCTSCHQMQVKSFRETMMGHLMLGRPRDRQEAMTCQTCHGPGRGHLRKPHKPSPGFLNFQETSLAIAKLENDRCLQCHQNG